MRRATSLIHTSEIKIWLNLPSTILVLIFVNVKTLIMLMLFLEQVRGRPGARGHHVGNPWVRLYLRNYNIDLCKIDAIILISVCLS